MLTDLGKALLPVLDDVCAEVRFQLQLAEGRVAEFHGYVRRWRVALDGTDGWWS